MRYKVFSVLVVLALVFSVTACDQIGQLLGAQVGHVDFNMDLSTLTNAGYSMSTVSVEMTHQTSGATASASLTVDNNNDRATGTIGNLETGVWDIDVELYDGTTLVGSGSGTVTIVAGQMATARISITVSPTTGSVNIIIEWGEAYVNTSDVTTTDTTTTVTQLTPGSAGDVTGYVSFTDQDGDPITNLNNFNFVISESLDQSNWTTLNQGSITVTTVSSSGQAISTVLTMDYSGSMSSTDIGNMESATSSFINNMNTSDQAQIVKFGGSVIVYQSFTSDKTLLVDAVNGGFSGSTSSTALYDSVYSALTDLNAFGASGLKAVLAFTDGRDNGSSHTASDCIDYSTQNYIPIYSIGFGSADQAALGAIATSGVNEYAPDSSSLTEIYNQIANRMSETYVIDWETIGSSGDTVYVRVTTTYESASGVYTSTYLTSYSLS